MASSTEVSLETPIDLVSKLSLSTSPPDPSPNPKINIPKTNAQRKAAIADATALNTTRFTRLVEAQGPWDSSTDPLSLHGTPSLPMPVKIASESDLAPFFAHLGADGQHLPLTDPELEPKSNSDIEDPSTNPDVEDPITNRNGTPGIESESTPVPMLEFPKGVIYSDARMDLCKMVVGPSHIAALLDSLSTNTFVRHFLLGNNIIGPRGARRIARFVDEHPEQMETWYLAGNCIDTASLQLMTKAFVCSDAITNLWLKRNPLGKGAAANLFALIVGCKNLRTLDVDQTSLGDAGVAKLFSMLANHHELVALRNLYMNGNGIGAFGAAQLARYLASPHCRLESLYMSLNPLGNAGIEALAAGLAKNTSIQRLSLESVGVSGTGVTTLLDALTSHRNLRALHIGTAYQTRDLNARFNYLADDVSLSVRSFILGAPSLQFLDLGYTAMSGAAYMDVLREVAASATLIFFNAQPGSKNLNTKATYRKLIDRETHTLKKEVFGRLLANVRTGYGRDWTYERFQREEQRFLLSPRDVRLIDSVYRNRDAGLARRKLKILEKDWEVGDETLVEVMQG